MPHKKVLIISRSLPLNDSEAATRGIPKKAVLKNFAKFTGKKPVMEFLFNKVGGLKAKKRLQNRHFPVNIAKLLRTPIF